MNRATIIQHSTPVFGRRRFRNAVIDFSYEILDVDRESGPSMRLVDARDLMDGLWTRLIQHVLDDGASPDDLIRIRISHMALTHGDIVVSLRKIHEMTPDAIWEAIERILQSYQTLEIDSSLNIIAGIIRIPRGA